MVCMQWWDGRNICDIVSIPFYFSFVFTLVFCTLWFGPNDNCFILSWNTQTMEWHFYSIQLHLFSNIQTLPKPFAKICNSFFYSPWFSFIKICASTDVVSIPKTNENFRLLYDTKGRFRLHSVRDDEAKVCSDSYQIYICIHLFPLQKSKILYNTVLVLFLCLVTIQKTCVDDSVFFYPVYF